jgi:hypothetical protein
MKMFIKISALVFIVVLSLRAQQVVVSYNLLSGILCRFNFNPIQINNDYLYLSPLNEVVSEDSIKTDSLIFELRIADKIFIRNISFSRKGQIYCSTDSFPIRDSVNWSGNSLSFQDSVLGVSPSSSGQSTTTA